VGWKASELPDLTGLRAIVTGANSGIGFHTTKELVAHGAQVVLACRNVASGEAAAAAMRGGGAVRVARLDLASAASVREFAETWDGPLDLLVNNAGRGAPPVPIEDLAFTDWQDVVGANLTGAFLCTQQAFRLMRSQQPKGGRIINNGSISAHTPRPNSAPYTATKHAITGLTKSTALDGRAHDIACGQIDIGNAATPMTARMADGVTVMATGMPFIGRG
jgi:NAD(P)-dependent dehydrogenase (short-subunit alcohol dehydrogenase family)